MAIEELLDGFIEIHNIHDHNTTNFPRLLDGFLEARKSRIKSQRATAEDMNIFEILNFKYDEVRHSKFLAWLLDLEGEHAQESLFFKNFLKCVKLPIRHADVLYKVETEVKHDDSQIDIEIAGIKNEFIIHIETKVNAAEGEEQLKRETNDLKKKGNTFKIDSENIHALYLTPEGSLPGNAGIFRAISWRQIAEAIKAFKNEAEAERVKWVAEQYLAIIESFIIPTREE